MTIALKGNSSGGVIEAGGVPAANISANGFPFMKNKLINGEVTRINQRGVANWAAVANGAYGYDRWKKIDASNMTQIIEAGNFRPSTVHTLSGVGVTTQQITSPASGNWTLPNIPIAATNVQVEEGLEATPFERRPIAYELSLCQRYFCTFFATTGSAYPTASSAESASPFFLPVQMRTAPAITVGTLGVNINIASDSFSSTTITPTGGTYLVVQGGAVGNFRGARFDNQANAEL